MALIPIFVILNILTNKSVHKEKIKFIVILVYVFNFHTIVNVYKRNVDLGQNYPLPSSAQFRIGLAQIQIPNHLSFLIKGF